MKPGLTSTATSRLCPGLSARIQKLLDNRCSGPMHCRARRHLQGLQIDAALLAQIGKHDFQQPCDFSGYFLPDRFRRFFSSGPASSVGRARQIRVLNSTNSRLNS